MVKAAIAAGWPIRSPGRNGVSVSGPRNGEAGAGGRVPAVCISHIGFGLETGQSLPKHSCAPDRARLPKGYCHAERSGPRNGRGSSVIFLSLDAPQLVVFV